MFMKGKLERKKTRIKVLVVGFAFMLLFFSSGCREFNPLDLENAPELVEAVEANRLIEPLEENEAGEIIKEVLYTYEKFEEVDPDKISFFRGNPPAKITEEEALEEVDFLFKMLKYGYAGYGMFGGDETFGASRERIQSEIRGKGEISTEQHSQIISGNLSFINDGHFRFDRESIFTRYQLHYSEEMDFLRDEKGYYIANREVPLYLEAINGKKPEEYLKLSLNANGELVYRLGVLHPVSELPYRATLSFAENQENQKVVFLYPVEDTPFDRTVYDYYETKGIPVIVNRIAPLLEEEEVVNFIEEAGDLKDAEVAILDIRGHIGGSDFIPRSWVENYTSSRRELKTGRLFVDLCTQTSMEFRVRWDQANGRDGSWARSRFAPTPGGWSEIQFSLPEFKKNDRFLIVLVDSNNASAGESFVRFLKQVENVIIIGSNTRGAGVVGNVGSFSLPHSKIPVQMGISVFLDVSLSFTEGVGLKPDIWINPGDALDLAVKFTDNYLR